MYSDAPPMNAGPPVWVVHKLRAIARRNADLGVLYFLCLPCARTHDNAHFETTSRMDGECHLCSATHSEGGQVGRWILCPDCTKSEVGGKPIKLRWPDKCSSCGTLLKGETTGRKESRTTNEEE